VVRAADHENRDPVLRFDRLEDGAPLGLDVLVEDGLRDPRLLAREVVLVLGDSEARSERLEHTPRHQRGLDERHGRIEKLDSPRREKIDLFGEGRLHDIGCTRDDGAARVVHRVGHESCSRA